MRTRTALAVARIPLSADQRSSNKPFHIRATSDTYVSSATLDIIELWRATMFGYKRNHHRWWCVVVVARVLAHWPTTTARHRLRSNYAWSRKRQKKEETLSDFLYGSGGRTRTSGLRVMSPTSCQLLYPAMYRQMVISDRFSLIASAKIIQIFFTSKYFFCFI